MDSRWVGMRMRMRMLRRRRRRRRAKSMLGATAAVSTRGAQARWAGREAADCVRQQSSRRICVALLFLLLLLVVLVLVLPAPPLAVAVAVALLWTP